MSDEDIGPKIVLEGEKEYRSAIGNINRDMKVLTSEMKATSAEFDGNANSVQALTKKNEILNKEFDTQEKKVRTLQGALESVKSIYGENSNQVKDWQTKLNNANAELSKLDKELKTNDNYLDEAKTSAAGTAKSIDEFGKEVKTAGESTLKTGDIIKANLTSAAIIGGVQALGTAMGNAATKTVNLVKGTAAYADDMLTMSTQTGVSTDKLQAYNYMAELTDTSLEDMTKSMAKNIKSMSSAQSGSEKYVDAYKKLKVEWDDGNGKLRNSEDVYWDVIDALKGITDQTERDSISMQLFGKSAQELNPLIAQGSEGVKKLTEEAKSMGAVLSTDTLDSLGKTDDALQRMYQATDIAKRKFGAEMAPVVTEAVGKITTTITDMDDELANFAGGALNAAVNGLTWVIDNSGLVVSGLSGIGAGMAVFKAGSAIQTGMDLAVKGWQAYKTATEGATIAQYAMNVAQNVSPVGVLATAVGALTAGMILYKASISDTKSELELYNDNCEENLKVSKSLNQTIKDNIKTRQSNTDEIKSQYGAASVLSDKLFDLAEKENLSNKEKTEMSALVNELNTSIPGLGLTIDAETGILNKQRGEVDGLITSNLELAKVKAAQADLTKIAQDQYDAEKKLNDLKEQEKEQTEKLNQATNEWTGNNEGAKIANHDLEEQLKKTKGEIANTEENVSNLGKEWDTASGYIRDHSSVDQTTKAVSNFGDTVEEAGDQTAASNEEAQTAIKKLTDTYEQAVKDRTKDIKSAMGLFDDFALDTSISGKKLMNNLKDQINGMKDWAQNLKSLAKKGIDDGLLKELEDMGPEAASQISALNQLSEPELKKYSDMWKEKSKLARKQAVDELSGLKEDTDKKIDEITKSVETKLYNSGKNSADGYAEGFKKQNPYMTSTMNNLFDDAVAEVNSKLGIHSPSTVFAKMGIHSVEGYVKGIKDSKSMVGKSMQELGEEILSKAQKSLDNYKVWHSMSLKDEVEYWDGIRKQLKKGTQARLDADKEYLDAMKSFKEEQKNINNEIVSDAQTRLSNYKVWHNMSAEDEVKYWDKIRKEIKKGTQARIDADKEYLEAKAQQQEEEKELLQKQTETEKEYADNCKKVQEDLVTNINEANQKYNDAVESRTKAITGAMGLFSMFTANDVSGENLLNDLQSQVTGLQDWRNNLNGLKSRGIDSALLSELEEMGPAAAGEIAALNQLSSTELDKYVSLWQEKNKLAKDQAISELEGLKTETATKIQELTTQANKDLSNYNKEYKKAMKELGVSIKEPITVLKASAVSDGEKIVTKITKSIKKNASSKETKDNVNTLNTKVTSELSKMAIDAVGIGANVVSGVISGMNSKTSELTKAASDMVTAALKSAKKTGKINSPSQLFRDKVGKYLAQGIGVGFSDEMSKISLDMSKSIPTDYEVNGANNITGSQITENSNLYNAFAAVATDILVPVLMKIGANFNVQTDKNGIVKIIRDESIDYYNRTGKGLFPA